MLFGYPYELWKVIAIIVGFNSTVAFLLFYFERSAERFRGDAIARFAAENGLTYDFYGASAWKEGYARLPLLWGGRFLNSIRSVASGRVEGIECRLFEYQGMSQNRYTSRPHYTVAAFHTPGGNRPRFTKDMQGSGADKISWHTEGEGEWTLVFRYGAGWTGCGYCEPEPAAFRAFLLEALAVHRKL